MRNLVGTASLVAPERGQSRWLGQCNDKPYLALRQATFYIDS